MRQIDALRAARWGVAAMFFVNGAGYANWVVRIPAIQERLSLSEGALGLALLGVPAGALLSMPLTGWLAAHFGSRHVTAVSALAFCAAVPIPGFAASLPALVLALVAIGMSSGAMDVSMNAQAVAVELRMARPIMSSFHGLFSLGGLAGSAAGGYVASLGIRPEAHLGGAALVLALGAVIASRVLLPASADATAGGPMFARPSRELLGLGVLAFSVLLGEGAMADWSAVYLRESLGTGPGFAASGYAAFSFAMAGGRLAGDLLSARFGAAKLVRTGGTLAAVGLTGALALGQPWAAVVGFACAGAGFSIVFPNVLSATGRMHAGAAGTAIPAVSTMGYTGFLAGPPLIGFAAELSTLRLALGVVVLFSLTIALLARTVGRPAAR